MKSFNIVEQYLIKYTLDNPGFEGLHVCILLSMRENGQSFTKLHLFILMSVDRRTNYNKDKSKCSF